MAFVIEPRPFDHPDVTAMIASIQGLYSELYGNYDEDATSPGQFAPPHGLFLVGYLDGAPIACGGWRRTGTAAEIKRMWVSDSARGNGLARRLLAELEMTAATAGVRRMVLNTGFRQLAAIALYESSGYRRTDERFGHYADTDGAFFFGKSLVTADSPSPGTETGR